MSPWPTKNWRIERACENLSAQKRNSLRNLWERGSRHRNAIAGVAACKRPENDPEYPQKYRRCKRFLHTNLNRANLRGAILPGTIFSDVNLREVKELTSLDHRGPSRIELYSVQLPQDGSALHFLRGAGAPDEWIDDYRAHMMYPIQYHSCFISYAHQENN